MKMFWRRYCSSAGVSQCVSWQYLEYIWEKLPSLQQFAFCWGELQQQPAVEELAWLSAVLHYRHWLSTSCTAFVMHFPPLLWILLLMLLLLLLDHPQDFQIKTSTLLPLKMLLTSQSLTQKQQCLQQHDDVDLESGPCPPWHHIPEPDQHQHGHPGVSMSDTQLLTLTNVSHADPCCTTDHPLLRWQCVTWPLVTHLSSCLAQRNSPTINWGYCPCH